MQQEYYLGSSLVSRAQNTTAGLRRVGSGVVARAQLYKGHELGQEARAHARCTTCNLLGIHPTPPWARASIPEPNVLGLRSALQAQHA